MTQLLTQPAAPKVVKVAAGLHVVGGVLWLVAFVLDMVVSAQAGTFVASPLLAILDFCAYVSLALLVWAGLDTRLGVIAVLVALAIVSLPGPLWNLVRGDAFTPPGVAMLVALAGSLVLCIVGVRLLYRPGTKTFLAESQAHQLAVKGLRRRR